MGKLKRAVFTVEQMRKLEATPNVQHVSRRPSRTHLHLSWQQ